MAPHNPVPFTTRRHLHYYHPSPSSPQNRDAHHQHRNSSRDLCSCYDDALPQSHHDTHHPRYAPRSGYDDDDGCHCYHHRRHYRLVCNIPLEQQQQQPGNKPRLDWTLSSWDRHFCWCNMCCVLCVQKASLVLGCGGSEDTRMLVL